jgi:peptidyl-prolyl cis-trans isomerase C
MTGTLVLLCSTGSVFAQIPSGGGGKAAASVNGEIITMAELEAVIKQDGPMAVPLPESERKQHQQTVLSALIDTALLKQFLKQQPPIDPKEIDQHMGEFVAALQKENKTLADFCRQYNQTPAQIKDSLAAAFQWRAYAGTRISDQQVLAYYQENKDMFDKVLVHAAEIMLHVPAQASRAEREQAKARLAQLREDIVGKKIDFAAAAQQYSQGVTKSQGGDLGTFPHLKGSLSPLPEPLMQAAFALPPGQISEVLESEWGVHLLKVIERKPGEPSDFNTLKETARQLCIEEMQQSILQSERQKAKIEIYLPH